MNFLTVKEVALILRTTSITLARWRKRGCGPAWYRSGQKILYTAEGVNQFLRGGPKPENHTRASETSAIV